MSTEGADISTVAKIAPQHRELEAPLFLREFRGWMSWKYEQVADEPKPRKIPYYVDGGRRHGQQGSPEDRAKLATFAAARAAAARRGHDGVGIALLPEFGITALDFDRCVAPDGSIPPEVEAIVARTYSEFSPSGEGIRAFVKGSLGNHKSPAKGNDFGFETFSSTGYVTLSGNLLPICEIMGFEDYIADADDNVRKLCERRFGSPESKINDPDNFMAGHEPRIGLTPEEIEKAVDSLDSGMGRDDWIKVGMGIHHETEGDDTGFDIWNDWSSTADNYVSEEDLRLQWDSFTRRQGSGPVVTMRSVLKMVKDANRAVSTEDLKAAIEEGETIADDSALVRTPDSYDGKFPVLSARDLAARPPSSWHIKGILPQADIVILYGASTAGKSFVAIDLGAAIARGIDWRERRVKKGRVILIAAEGSGGIGKRLNAYAKQHEMSVDDLDIGVIIVPPNFCEKEDMTELARAIAAAGGCDIIIVDTFAQVTPGANENSGEDMGLALANCRVLHDATSATIVLVHHAGKDLSKGSRGWSGLKAAVDAEIEILRHENGDREIHLTKMKDGEDGLRFGFKLEVIDLGIDADGDAITSCVAVESALTQPETREPRNRREIEQMSPLERLIYDTADQDFGVDDRTDYETFVAAVMAKMPFEEGKRDTRRQRVIRAIDTLKVKKDGFLTVAHGFVIFYID